MDAVFASRFGLCGGSHPLPVTSCLAASAPRLATDAASLAFSAAVKKASFGGATSGRPAHTRHSTSAMLPAPRLDHAHPKDFILLAQT